MKQNRSCCQRLESGWGEFQHWWGKNPSINSLIIGICVLGLFLVIIMFLTCEGGIFAWLLGTRSKKETIEFIAFGIGGMLATMGAIAINRRSDAQVNSHILDKNRYDDERFSSAMQNLSSTDKWMRRSSFYQFYYLAKRTEDELIKSDIYGILESHLWLVSDNCELQKSRGLYHMGKQDFIMERHTLLGIMFKEYDETFVFNPDKEISVNLQSLYLVGADLLRAKLMRANISSAKLSSAKLSDANLSGANLSGADFSGEEPWDEKYWHDTIVHNTYMSKGLTDIRNMGANLSGANLSGANLSGANLQKAQLKDANLHDVSSIKNADFRGAKIGDDPITENYIPENKGEYYADWTDNLPTKPHNPQKNKKKLRVAPVKSEGDKV